jgi:hypothetical protein
MELRRIRLTQELKEARENLLDLNFENGSTRPYAQVSEWVNKWDATFRKCNTLGHGMVNIRSAVITELDGYEQERDAEIFNELRPVFVGFIDLGLSILDQQYEVKPMLEAYIKRIKDTKLAELLKEFNAAKDTSPNLVAIGFRTILSLIIQEKAKRVNSQSKTATRADLAPQSMIDSARNEKILSTDEQRLVDSFVSTHKDVYDMVAHRPGAHKTVDKGEVSTMVDLLNKLLPSIIN